MFIKIVFWVCLLIVFYSYVGYGILLWIYLKLFPKKAPNNKTADSGIFQPAVSLVIAAYNEAAFIQQKIANTLDIDYPKELLNIYIVTDGSSDETPAIVASYAPLVQLEHQPERKGKVHAINRVMDKITTPFVVFCDANTLLNESCIKELVKHYQDLTIGAVAGEKKVVDFSNSSNAAGSGEGMYWKYESTLKKLDARFYTVVGAAGELFSIRTSLFEHTAPDVLLDDFLISMNICKKGYRVMYEPNAYAMEAPSHSMKEEQKRKIRISAGAFQSMVMLKDLLNIFKFGKLSFQYISHRVLRWSFCPLLLPAIVLLNLLIVKSDPSLTYLSLLILQGLFYCSALAGWAFAQQEIKVKALYVPYYFLFMNVSLYLGFFRYLNKTQTVLWDKAIRKQVKAL